MFSFINILMFLYSCLYDVLSNPEPLDSEMGGIYKLNKSVSFILMWSFNIHFIKRKGNLIMLN